jgi:hypothetical protein
MSAEGATDREIGQRATRVSVRVRGADRMEAPA